MKSAFAAVLLALSSSAFAQEVEGAPAGSVATARSTVIHSQPKASGAVMAQVESGATLRWIMGQKKNGFVRVMQPKGKSGWVTVSALDPSSTVAPTASTIALGASAQPCKPSLAACE